MIRKKSITATKFRYKEKEVSKEPLTKKEDDKKKSITAPNLDIKKKEEVSKEPLTKKEDDKKKNQLPPLPNLDIKKKEVSKEPLTKRKMIRKKIKKNQMIKMKTNLLWTRHFWILINPSGLLNQT